ncbi:hypothetical protein BB559_003698 [Furculomyces boomerangus]|uniref:Uncharacterized protein n=1 Tax=Furculomyces boomerangus TaxID=61424 RepID=A0A2T9YJP2_9FUNG|nr:hypothetical protein BB559_003698 [Furculomyces boomerangus]
MTESIKESKNVPESFPEETKIQIKSVNPNPFDKLDEYALETIFIHSENPEMSTLSRKLFRVSHEISTSKIFDQKCLFKSTIFTNIFYSRHKKIAKKEELMIELINKGIDIKGGGKYSAINIIFEYEMNNALYMLLRTFKKVKIEYTPEYENPFEPDIFKDDEYYIIEPLISDTDIMGVINGYELYRDENIKMLLNVLEMETIKLDLIKDCGISIEDLFLKDKRKIYLYRNMNTTIDFDRLIKTTILHDQPELTNYIIEYKEYPESKLQELANKVRYNHSIPSNNQAYALVNLYIKESSTKGTPF